MRRLGLIILAAAVGAAFLATGALAKEGGVELSSTPSRLNAGDKWTPTLHLIDGTPEMIAAAKPGITVVYIDAPAAAPATPITPAGDTSAFPVWPAVGGGLAFLLAVLGTALALRQRRLGFRAG